MNTLTWYEIYQILILVKSAISCKITNFIYKEMATSDKRGESQAYQDVQKNNNKA